MRALITGISGQDGQWLARLLLDKGYEVAGLVRRKATVAHQMPEALRGRVVEFEGDLGDEQSLRSALRAYAPNEVYNLAAQSHVQTSFTAPAYTFEVNALGVLRLLEAVVTLCPSARLYQASTSEMFGSARAPQNELTPFAPRSPYAIAKVAAHHAVKVYREQHGLYACSGILFNHESELRGERFVSRKVTRAIAACKLGLQGDIELGNLDAVRDWGYAPDYVRAMWLMLQQRTPTDYVIGTGVAHSVRQLVETAIEVGELRERPHIHQHVSHMRPLEVHHLCADARLAQDELGWHPETSFREMIRRMVAYDIALLS